MSEFSDYLLMAYVIQSNTVCGLGVVFIVLWNAFFDFLFLTMLLFHLSHSDVRGWIAPAYWLRALSRGRYCLCLAHLLGVGDVDGRHFKATFVKSWAPTQLLNNLHHHSLRKDTDGWTEKWWKERQIDGETDRWKDRQTHASRLGWYSHKMKCRRKMVFRLTMDSCEWIFF